MNKIKIFLSGGSGMVGSNIREALADSKYEIVCPGKLELDLLDYEKVNAFFRTNSFDLVIHTAGIVGGILANIDNPVKYLVENTDMARNVILSAKNNGVKRLINLGSSCMYPRNAKNPIKEESILTGELEPTNEGYAIAKIYALRLCEYINKKNQDCAYKTLIPCNLHGKYDKFEPHHAHLIPSIIYKVHYAKKNNLQNIEIWGNGDVRRECMYVSDLADFIKFTLENYDKIPNIINVGLGYDYTINEYYNMVAKVVGYQGAFTHDLTKPEGMKKKLVDIFFQTQLGWKPKYTFEQGIIETYNYLKNKY